MVEVTVPMGYSEMLLYGVPVILASVNAFFMGKVVRKAQILPIKHPQLAAVSTRPWELAKASVSSSLALAREPLVLSQSRRPPR